jgi:Holliday junction resolvase RusA-like endonuclease
MMDFSFRAYGTPRPQGSKRYVGNGRFIEASDVKPWRRAIADAVFREYVASGSPVTFTEPVVVYATFYMPKPPSVRRLLPSVAPDLDKLCRALGDGMSVDCGLLKDDSLIVRWHAEKVYAPVAADAGVSVTIRRFADSNESITTNEMLHFPSEKA